MKLNSKGFSLVSVMVAIGLAGGLSLAIMQIMKQASTGQMNLKSSLDFSEFRNQVQMILYDKKHCAASLSEVPSNPGAPFTFKKVDLDEPSIASEGQEIELYYGHYDYENNPRVRTQKKFSAVDSDFNTFGNVKIESIRFYMNNNASPPDNYAADTNITDSGVVKFRVTKKVNIGRETDHSFEIPIDVLVATDSAQDSEVVSCSNNEELLITNHGYPKCSLIVSHQEATNPWRSAALNMSMGGFIRMRMTGDVGSNDKIRVQSTCAGATDDITNYFKNCTFYFGQKDGISPASNHPFPDTYLAHTIGQASSDILNLTGDVNEDDSLYYRLTCPAGTDSDLDAYVKNKCMICFGQTYWNDFAPRHTCEKVVNPSGRWGRRQMVGNTGSNDNFFFGFFCGEGDYPYIQDAVL